MEVKHCIVILSLLTACFQHILAQDDPSMLRQRFEKWQQSYPKYRVHAFFNQTKYSPGDTAYFTAYYFAEGGRRVEGRQILQLSLYDCSGRQISHINFFVRDGMGFNQIALPDSLRPGLYEVDIYSDWMKNFDASFLFHQRILVVGKNQVVPTTGPLDEALSFFPEGGSLVAGVTNRVVVKAQGIASVNADLVNSSGGLVTSFAIEKSGMGVVVFKPESGKTYAAHINGRLFSLPEPVTDKVSVFLTPKADHTPLKIILGASPNAAFRNEDLSLLIVARDQLYASVPVKFEERESVQFNVPQNNLPGGAVQVWVLNAARKTLASRLFPVLDTTSVRAVLKVTPEGVNMRATVTAELTLRDASGNIIEGDFSVSAVSQALFAEGDSGARKTTDGTRTMDIISGNQSPFPEWDRWLITQPLPTTDWSNILAAAQPTPSHSMSKFLRKRGVAFDATTGKPVTDSIRISGFFLKNTAGYQAYTNTKGEFSFVFLFDLWGSDEMFYTAERNGAWQQNVRIKWIDENHHAPSLCAIETERPDAYGNFSIKKKLIDRSYEFYTRPQRPEAIPEDPNAILEDELTSVSKSVTIHDYILFPTMAETIREVIPLLKHRVVNGKSTVRAFVDRDNYVPSGDPLYIIDGVITRDTEFFLSLVPDDVLTVKVVSDYDNLRALGDLGKNGVVFVHTKNTDLTKLKSATVLPVEGFNKPTNFNASSSAADTISRRPNFKSTIFWAPSISTSSTGKTVFSFQAPDNVGPMRILVQGLTRSGKPFSATTECYVNFVSSRKD